MIKNICRILIGIVMLSSCNETAQYYEESGSVFHTLYHIKYQAPEPLTEKIDAELQAFNLTFNPFNPNSMISKVNRNEDVELNDRFINVFEKAMEVSENSGGAFDVTVSPLINLWGFGFGKAEEVTQDKIDSIMTFVGYRKIRIENRRIIKDDRRIELNFSAIAKGFASDVIAGLLEREMVENYMVEIGGEVVAKGKNPRGECWNIGINKPENDSTGFANQIERIISLCGRKGLATSGNYRNYYIKDGKKYAHTIDPKTGYPSENTILSATIVAPDCMTADAYATAFMSLGREAALEMANKLPDVEYLIITAKEETGGYEIEYSQGLRRMLKN
ncbi:MAG: FAD:protein FMN transferase [Tannerella sp.]|nr:FAD:protein FMN transferase [Tannerella sp.]